MKKIALFIGIVVICTMSFTSSAYAVQALTSAKCVINDNNWSTGDNYDVWFAVSSEYPSFSGWIYVGNYTTPQTIVISNYPVNGVPY
jgi:hypothetical protein